MPLHNRSDSVSTCRTHCNEQALQCCVIILRSLVEWYTRTTQAAALAAAAMVAAASPGVDVIGDDAASDSTAGALLHEGSWCLMQSCQLTSLLPSRLLQLASSQGDAAAR